MPWSNAADGMIWPSNAFSTAGPFVIAPHGAPSTVIAVPGDVDSTVSRESSKPKIRCPREVLRVMQIVPTGREACPAAGADVAPMPRLIAMSS